MSPRTTIAAMVYMSLGIVLRATYGTYHAGWVVVLAGLIAVLLVIVFASRRQPGETVQRVASEEFIFAAILMTFSVLLCLDPLVLTSTNERAMAPLRWVLGVTMATSVMLCVCAFFRVEIPKVMYRSVLLLAWASVISVRVLTVYAAPNPGIDVYSTNTRACEVLLAGQNPYTAEYADAYDGKYDYQPGFFYWPAYLYWGTVNLWLLGDVRFAAIIADVLAAAAMFWMGTRLGLRRRVVCLLPLVWLAHPVSLMMIELAWIDPVLIFGIAALAMCLILRRHLLTAVVIGLVAATKQYGVLIGLVTLVYLFSRDRREAYRAAAVSAVVWLAMTGPYLIMGAGSFYERTVAVYLKTSARFDSLSMVAFAKNQWDLEIPGWVLLVFYLAVVGGCCLWLLRKTDARLLDWSGVMAAAFSLIFLLGKQAFCNYYFLVAFLALLYVLFAIHDEQTAQPIAVTGPKSGSSI